METWIEGYTPVSKNTYSLEAEEAIIVELTPTAKPGAFDGLTANTKASLHVKVS